MKVWFFERAGYPSICQASVSTKYTSLSLEIYIEDGFMQPNNTPILCILQIVSRIFSVKSHRFLLFQFGKNCDKPVFPFNIECES